MKRVLLLISVLVSLASAAQTKKMIVAKDGTGNYKTVQAAFDAVPLSNKRPIVIYVRNGVYTEKLRLDSSKNNVTLVGEDKFKTILTYNDHTGKLSPRGDTINTYTSESFLMKANDFKAENITFQNDAGFTAGQAVAVQVAGDRAIFRNCRFLGFQDVLFTSNPISWQYYERCYIEGTTDFIFGSSTAWFEQCHIHSKKNSHVTAASTPQQNPFGYVFNDCVLTADTSLNSVSLGRPWRPFASVTYLNTYIDRHIIPKGWDNWRNPENEKTARYAEYNSYGPGGSREKRASWIRQLTDEEARRYTLKNVFPNWNPTVK
jgi:pectinesterase